MKVLLPPETATALLYRLRDLIDGTRGGEIQVLDAQGRVLFRMKLPRPCAPDPVNGVMALYQPKDPILPEIAGIATGARVVSDDHGVILELDVGAAGSEAAVEIDKLKIGLDDVIRARSRLILDWVSPA